MDPFYQNEKIILLEKFASVGSQMSKYMLTFKFLEALVLREW